MCPVMRFGRSVEVALVGSVRRCCTRSDEWHIMSFSTPPPCSLPCQNHGACGPLCSPAVEVGRNLLWARGARLAGRPYLARPQEIAADFDRRREHLILEIAVRQ